MSSSIFLDGQIWSREEFVAEVKYRLTENQRSIEVTNTGDHSVRRAPGLTDRKCELECDPETWRLLAKRDNLILHTAHGERLKIEVRARPNYVTFLGPA
jgi:hypothetical protein